MICPNCKTELADGSKFCGRCGTAITEPPAPEEAFNAAAETAETAQENLYQQPQQYDYQPDQNAQQYGYQPADGAQQYGYGYQPDASNGYGYQNGTVVAAAPKKSKKPLIIVIIAVVAAAAIGLTLFFVLRGCDKSRGSATDAFNDMIALMNDGKYEEAVKKYSLEGADADLSGLSSVQSYLSAVKIEGSVKKETTYKRGDADFDSMLRKVTTDDKYTGDITEVAELDVEIKVSMFGVDQSQETTLYMGRYKGAWKSGSGVSLY